MTKMPSPDYVIIVLTGGAGLGPRKRTTMKRVAKVNPQKFFLDRDASWQHDASHDRSMARVDTVDIQHITIILLKVWTTIWARIDSVQPDQEPPKLDTRRDISLSARRRI